RLELSPRDEALREPVEGLGIEKLAGLLGVASEILKPDSTGLPQWLYTVVLARHTRARASRGSGLLFRGAPCPRPHRLGHMGAQALLQFVGPACHQATLRVVAMAPSALFVSSSARATMVLAGAPFGL